MLMPSQKVRRFMLRAADLRATGHTWQQVGRKMHKTGEAVRSWTKRFPEYWEEVLTEARREVAGEARDEGLTALRTLLRSGDDKVKCNASTKLAGMPKDAEKSSATAEELMKFVQFLEGLSDEELESFMGEEEAQGESVSPGGAADAADSPSAA
jgi:hypothetical protein